MENKIKFVKYPIKFDEKNYGYALCRNCIDGGIQIPRPDYSDFIRILCPQCGDMVGICLKGKKSKKYFENVF